MPSIGFYRNYGKTFKKPRRPFEKERLDAELKTVGEYGLRNKRELWRVQMVLSKLRSRARSLLTLDEKDPKVPSSSKVESSMAAGLARCLTKGGSATQGTAVRSCAAVEAVVQQNPAQQQWRLFEGEALMRRMYRYGFLDETQNKLDYVLALNPTDVLERRLQPQQPPGVEQSRVVGGPAVAEALEGAGLAARAAGDKAGYEDSFRYLTTLVFKLGLAKSIHHARVLIRQRHIRVGKQIVNIPSFLVRVDSQKHIDFALNSPFGGGRPGRNKRKALARKGGDGGDEEEE
ncbi:hypothetical protein N2152v2_003967 [Parachlorella kessleri]